MSIEKLAEEFGLATNFNIQEFYEFGKEDMEQFIKSRPKMFSLSLSGEVTAMEYEESAVYQRQQVRTKKKEAKKKEMIELD